MKVCSECKLDKDFSEFHKRGNKLQSRCKKCKQILDHREYLDNKNKIFIQKKELRKTRRIWMMELKKGPCVDCHKQFHHAAMDWDHLPGTQKLFNLADGLRKAYPKERILREIEKCELVCACCHRIRSFLRSNLTTST